MKQFPILLFLLPLASLAQEKDKSSLVGEKNIIRLNLSSLVLENISVQYEREIGRNKSILIGARFMPKGSIPFRDALEREIDNKDVQVGNAKTGNFAITPEFRFYFGKKEALKGFYVAPYLRYANFDIDGPVSYNSGLTKKTGIFTGNINSFSGGCMIGAQFRLGKSWMLDCWIAGGHIGFASGTMTYAASTPLTASEQQSMRDNLDAIDIPFVKFTYTVNQNGAVIKADGNWAGLRGLGLNIGYRF